MGNTRLDTAAVRAAARQFDAAAEILDGTVRADLAELGFGGSTAGREHTARGDALRTALHRISADVAQWTRAADEIAAVLRAGVEGYLDAEAGAVAGVG